MKTQELVRLQDLNIDLLDANRNLISYLIQVYKRNGITHEEYQHAKDLLSQVSKALQKLNGKTTHQPTGNKILSTEEKHDKDSTDNETEPDLIILK